MMTNLSSSAAIACMLMLSACGGGASGGVASTPTPPTAATPTPAPTPAPPPSTANADLVNLTLSETFTNDAATGSASYPKIGDVSTISSGPATVSIVYDATSRTYTITNNSRSQSFAQSNIDGTNTNPSFTVFKKTSGTTTDTLSLTKPGTSGSLSYRYVGAGFWQRTVDGPTTVNGEFDAFTYGVETPDSAIVRTGGAIFDVDLLGVVARSDTVYNLSGKNQLTVNFLTGQITSGFGSVRETRTDNLAPGQSGEWQYTGTLASGANALNGQLTLYHTSTNSISGPAVGRFYGPGLDEIGIAFQGSGFGSRSVGTLIGRKSATTISAKNPSLTDLQFTESFYTVRGGSIAYSSSSSAGLPNVYSHQFLLNQFPFQVIYNAANKSFEMGSSPTLITTLGTADPSLTDSQFLGYSKTSPTEVVRMRMYRQSGTASEVALTYSSFVNSENVRQLAGGPTFWSAGNSWVPFGVTTPHSALPTTGSANYNGRLYGSAIDGNLNDEFAKVTGTISLAVNFGTAAVTGSIHPTITYKTGTIYDMGTAAISGGRYSNFQGQIDPPSVSGKFDSLPLANGEVFGLFFGPSGQELTGSFLAQYLPSGTLSASGRMWGAFGTIKQ